MNPVFAVPAREMRAAAHAALGAFLDASAAAGGGGGSAGGGPAASAPRARGRAAGGGGALEDSLVDDEPMPGGTFPRGFQVRKGETFELRDGDTLVFAHMGSSNELYNPDDPFLPKPGYSFVFRTVGHI